MKSLILLLFLIASVFSRNVFRFPKNPNFIPNSGSMEYSDFSSAEEDEDDEPQQRFRLHGSETNYYYIIQNFFFGGDKVQSQQASDDGNMVPESIRQTCESSFDCQKLGDLCINGYCQFVPFPSPHHDSCVADVDCKHILPKDQVFWMPVYCELGRCKFGHRTPKSVTDSPVEVQLCKKDYHCDDGFVCQNNACATAPSSTTTTTATTTTQLLTTKHPESTTHRKPHLGKCKINSDCRYPNGGLLPFPLYCHFGHCKMGILKPKTTTEVPSEVQFCTQSSQCINGLQCKNKACVASTPIASTTVTTPTTTPLHECNSDIECYALYKNDPFAVHQYCENGICLAGFRPKNATASPVTSKKPVSTTKRPTTKSSRRCNNDMECSIIYDHQNGMKYHRYCDNGVCVVGYRTTAPKNVTASPNASSEKPSKASPTMPVAECQRNRDCLVGKTVMDSFYKCIKGKCVQYDGFSSTSKPTSPVHETKTTSLSASKPTAEPFKCDSDKQCYSYLPHEATLTTPMYCHYNRCIFGERPHQHPLSTKSPTLSPLCERDTDCNGLYQPNHHLKPTCQHGHCVLSRATKKPASTTYAPRISETTKKPRPHFEFPPMCQHDFECVLNKRAYIHTYCDHGKCKIGSRHTTKTSTTTTTTVGPIAYTEAETTTAEPQSDVTISEKPTTRRNPFAIPASCEVDSDCKTLFKIMTYCDSGVCKIGTRRTTTTSKPTDEPDMSTTVAEEVAETTQSIPKTHEFPERCEVDKDCLLQENVVAYCHNLKCRKGRRPSRNPTTTTTTSAPQTTSLLSTNGSPLIVLMTESPTSSKHFKCKTDADCVAYLPFEAQLTTITHCYQEICILGPLPKIAATTSTTTLPVTEKIEATTRTGEIEAIETTSNTDIETTFEPSKATKPHSRFPKTCKKDSDCQIFEKLPVYCSHKKCVVGFRKHSNNKKPHHNLPEISSEKA